MRILFLHAAKTGGMSIRRMLINSGSVGDFDCLHNGILLEFRAGKLVQRSEPSFQTLPSYDFSFCFVRNPARRLASCYSYFLSGGLNQFQPGKFPIDKETQDYLLNNFPTLDSCCLALPEVAARIPHFKPISNWIDQLPSRLVDDMFIGRAESFGADAQAICRKLGFHLNNEAVPHINRSSIPASTSIMSPEAEVKSQRFYACDYERFGYPLG